jgi:hypothetical protein
MRLKPHSSSVLTGIGGSGMSRLGGCSECKTNDLHVAFEASGDRCHLGLVTIVVSDVGSREVPI